MDKQLLCPTKKLYSQQLQLLGNFKTTVGNFIPPVKKIPHIGWQTS
jgi:imidazoleglycerol phosphate synthase glutamine amidotransferase subunit HisH